MKTATVETPGGAIDLEEKQPPLLDLSGEHIDMNFVDDHQPLFVPKNPLHWKAHKLQVLVLRLDKMAANSKNANSFNAQSYLQILNAYIEAIEQIKKGVTDEPSDDAGTMGDVSEDTPQTVGQRKPAGLGAGVSSDNPFAR